MLKINNRYFNLDVETILLKLREYVLVKYNRLVLKSIKPINEDVMITCPYHNQGNERKPSMGVHKETGLSHCFTCGKVVKFDELVGNILGDTTNKAFITGQTWLFNTFDSNEISTRPGIDLPTRVKSEQKFYIPEEVLDKFRYYHPYMWKRKLTPEVVEKYDVGYDEDFQLKNKDTGKITHLKCLTFPVKDLSGRVVFIARRCVDTKLFHYPDNVEKPVYGLDKCFGVKSLVVVESIINCLTLETYGIDSVAFMGLGTKKQYEQISKCDARVVYLCFDGDSAGRRATERFIKNVKNKKIYVIKMLDNEDINSITKSQFFELYAQAKEVM